MASLDVVPTVVYPIPVEISNGYLIWDRIYYGWLFISSKNKLVQCNSGVWRSRDCQGFSEVFISTELPNSELTSIHTADLPHLLL